jgi:hypothetical protein
MRRTAQFVRSLLSILLITAGEGVQFLWLAVSSRAELSAEVLFLRKQLAFYREHQVPPRKLTDAALLLGAVVSTLQLESGIGDRQTGDPYRLASPRVQAVLAEEVAVGKTADSGKSSPADGAHGAGEPDLGRGAHRSRTFGEARNPGFAPNGAGVLAAREGSARR